MKEFPHVSDHKFNKVARMDSKRMAKWMEGRLKAKALSKKRKEYGEILDNQMGIKRTKKGKIDFGF